MLTGSGRFEPIRVVLAYMHIEKIQNIDRELLKSFKEREYPQVDREHYGETLPDFEKYEYTFVAKEEENIIGYITIELELGVALIRSLMVGHESQRRGVATQLVEQAEREVKKLGAHKIWLQTGFEWSAQKLYTSLGYVERCVLKNFYGHKDFMIFDKELSSEQKK